jgi:hypothetical protein
VEKGGVIVGVDNDHLEGGAKTSSQTEFGITESSPLRCYSEGVT